MILVRLALFLLDFLHVNISESIYESDKDGNNQDKEICAIADYLADHRVWVNNSNVMHPWNSYK